MCSLLTARCSFVGWVIYIFITIQHRTDTMVRLLAQPYFGWTTFEYGIQIWSIFVSQLAHFSTWNSFTDFSDRFQKFYYVFNEEPRQSSYNSQLIYYCYFIDSFTSWITRIRTDRSGTGTLVSSDLTQRVYENITQEKSKIPGIKSNYSNQVSFAPVHIGV